MTIAHIGGVPFEEWLGPLAATGTTVMLSLGAALRRVRRRPPRPTVAGE
jgi:hypothetical protein